MSRTKVRVAVILVVVLAGLGYWAYWSSQADERRVNALLDQIYEYSEIDDEGSRLAYQHQTCGPTDDRGRTTGRASRVAQASVEYGPDVDFRPSAEVAARRFEADGWLVARFVSTGGARPSFQMDLQRGPDRLTAIFQTEELIFTANWRTCDPLPWPPDPPRNTEPVDEFPDPATVDR